MRIGRTLLVALTCVTTLAGVEHVEAKLGTGTQWIVYEADGMWFDYWDPTWTADGYQLGAVMNLTLWPYGGPDTLDTTKFYEYHFIADVKVPDGFCGTKNRALVSTRGFLGGYSFDSLNEVYYGSLKGRAKWECENADGSRQPPSAQSRDFSFTFNLYPTGTRYGEDHCPWSTPTAGSCSWRRLAQAGRAFFCWDAPDTSCNGDRKTIIEYHQLDPDISRTWRGIGNGPTS